MQEIKSAIEKTTEGISVDFTEVAITWATFCLKNLKDDLLSKGLDISKALVQYDITLRNL